MGKLDDGNPPHFISGAWINKEMRPRFLSGGAGLVSTTADYLRFGMMMRAQGTLDGVRLVSRKTIELMTAPHLRPDQYFLQGASFGLGFTVLTSPAQAGMLGSVGAYEAGGAAHTNLWYDPHEDLMGLLMVQYVSSTPSMVGMDFKSLAAAAIED
jgi:CubicO group peptidase (beta-lactamase class C family)